MMSSAITAPCPAARWGSQGRGSLPSLGNIQCIFTVAFNSGVHFSKEKYLSERLGRFQPNCQCEKGIQQRYLWVSEGFRDIFGL